MIKTMGRLSNFLTSLFARKSDREPADVDRLHLAFRDRYHKFKLLLNANNKALEIMADIETALQGQRPFGMSFIKASYTAVSVNVFRMIKNIEDLAPGKYRDLISSFSDIQNRIDRILKVKRETRDKRLVIPLEAVTRDMADIVGSKMAHIGEIRNQLGLPVPEGFVITSAGYEKFLKDNDLQTEIDRIIQSATADRLDALYALSAEIQQRIIRAPVPDDLASEVHKAFGDLQDKTGKPVTLAMRSSAIGEDTAESSFAGQYRSELNVGKENILQAYKEVLASKYSLQAISYRLNRGFRDEDITMSVGCMVMVEAVSGGVAYSRNPLDFSDDAIFINAVLGLPKSVVDGSVACDLFVVDRTPPMAIIREEIKKKEVKYVCLPGEGVCREEPMEKDGVQPSITSEQALRIAEISVTLEQHYGAPQDIEWAVSLNGEIVMLQCRPLQAAQKIHGINLPEDGFQHADDILIKGGTTASSGAACGQICVVEKGVDVLQFPEGAVLLTRQALPRWAPLLNRAAAVVTEQGGFAGHLANVAREFHVPALFGLKGAVDILKNGQQVTVDADNHVIYAGRIESLLNRPQKPVNLMAGSPVYEILFQISRHIVPLNLLDPDSPEFRPASCKTFHDITRFVHEKAVHEMFHFGKEHHFSERSSKQLLYRVPMQWWVLNLDDGFDKEVKGKYVRLENIVSIPMLAFWKGFAAVPWDGPPAIDGKGFLTVMFRSTTNPALTTGVSSSYAERNYFMVSRNYCSLSSRLGYHFSILEAMVGDRPIENYISFQFKGGAADFDRRLKRVHLIGDILEKYGFRTELKEDMLAARMEGYDMEFMKKRLEILGYLTLHTRQLDMIMSNEAVVACYRSKMISDIQTLLSAEHSEGHS